MNLTADDRFSIVDYLQRFYKLVDTGRAGETAAMFSPDATLTFGEGAPKPGTLHGPEIAAAMRAREQLANTTTRHVISNISFVPADNGEVSVQYLMTLYRSDGGPLTSIPAFVADVDESLVREVTGWRISRRTVSPIFSRQ